MHPNDFAAPFRPETRRRRSVDAIIAVLVAALILAAVAGDSVRRAGEEMDPGLIRDVVTASAAPPAGSPTGCRSPTPPTAPPRGSRPTTTSAATAASPSPRSPERPPATPSRA